ncbi:MAG: class I SAM-dependent DNA methyltransferase [Proteobacteria bacterium]|nr:MAG: class I SAM-dependent DNA methyltransferase [Pseudomonadota bacterium]
MYMCKETIKKAVLQKFRDVKGWDFSDFNALYNKVSGFNETNDILEANDIINSITICDPAVGSGHFLVSALNEILSIKSELGILCDSTGRKLNNHKVNVENDELVVTNSQNQLFEYIPNNDESQRIQETLFKEKQTIIENCLFGVDINPNSVKICRLRLWIELLKNAYYRPDGELETLPNIDINIKCGNSLISRFSLDSDLKKALKNTRHTIVAYQAAINTYSHAKDKQEKNEMRDLINEIKNSFKNEIKKDHQVYKDLDKFEGQLVKLTKQVDVFGFNKKQEDEFNKKVAAKVSEIETQKKKIKHLENNKIYNNAFEWRFEFPEVLSDDGEFIGFDVVLANPPYMRIQEIKASQPAEKIYYETKYENAEAAYDLANIFFELAVNISSSNCKNAFIFPHKFFNTSAASGFRSYLRKGQYIDKISHFGANMIFEDAITYTCVAQFSKSQSKGFYFQRFPFKSDFKSLMLDEKKYTYISYHMIEKASELYGKNQWILFDNKEGYRLFEKIYNQRSNISSKFEKISQGIATAKDEIYLFRGEKNENYIKGNFINDEVGREIEEGIMRPYLKGKEVQRYSSPLKNLYILFPYNLSESGKANIMEESEIRQNYPNAYQWLKKTEKEHRKKDNKSTNDEFWYRYARNQGVDKIERTKLSSMEICVTHPNVILDNDNFYHPTTVYSWYLNENAQESYEYYLAIANSKLLWWFLIITGDTLQGDARRFKTNYLNPFPLPETVSQEIQSEIENKVNEVITLKKHNSKINTENIERQIDYIIYDIYGLTKDEIKVVEEV